MKTNLQQPDETSCEPHIDHQSLLGDLSRLHVSWDISCTQTMPAHVLHIVDIKEFLHNINSQFNRSSSTLIHHHMSHHTEKLNVKYKRPITSCELWTTDHFTWSKNTSSSNGKPLSGT